MNAPLFVLVAVRTIVTVLEHGPTEQEAWHFCRAYCMEYRVSAKVMTEGGRALAAHLGIKLLVFKHEIL